MNEFRRARIQCEIDMLTSMRDRVSRIRDDEDRAIGGCEKFGHGDPESSDVLTDVCAVLLVAAGKLEQAKRRK